MVQHAVAIRILGQEEGVAVARVSVDAMAADHRRHAVGAMHPPGMADGGVARQVAQAEGGGQRRPGIAGQRQRKPVG